MATIKLNDNHRRTIQKRLLGDRFDKRTAELELRKRKLGQAIYDERFSRTMQAKMAELPDGWLPSVTTIKARLSGKDVGIDMKKRLRVTSETFGYHNESSFLLNEPTGPRANEWHLIAIAEQELKDEREKLSHEIRAVVNSASTANRLVTIWPEIKSVVDDVCATYSVNTNLPAPRVEDLNKALGLK